MASSSVPGIPRLKAYLQTLAAGSQVAVITFIGTFCPITLGHMQCVQVARDVLIGATKPIGAPLTRHFDACVAIMCCNPDNYVTTKMTRQKQKSMMIRQRQNLLLLASSKISEWLTVVDYLPHQFEKALSCDVWRKLCLAHPSLKFVHVSLGGADDIVTRKKWYQPVCSENRMITMGRAGLTQKLLHVVQTCSPPLNPNHFILGPEVPATSSTKAREALIRADLHSLGTLLHPSVTLQCLQDGPYRPRDHGTLMSALAKAKAVAETYHKTHAKRKTNVPAHFASPSSTDDQKGTDATDPDTQSSHSKKSPSTAKPMYHDPKAGILAFYGHQKEYGFLSNFYPTRFRLRDVCFDTSEQAIMYCKASLMGDKDSLEKLKAPGLDPKQAKALGRAVKPWNQALWDAEVRNIAFEVLMAKFSQNPKIAANLDKTGNKRLVEAAPKDRIWGVGLGKSQVMAGTPLRGQNILGNTLERVRASLRKNRANTHAGAVDVASSGIVSVTLMPASNHSRRKIIKVQPPVFKLKYFQKKAKDKLKIKHAKTFVEAETNRLLAPGDSLRNGVLIIVSK